MKVLLSLLIALLPLPLAAAYAARDVVIPIAGKARGGDGRLYLTALWITNASDRDGLDASLTFHPADQKIGPRRSALHLAPGETRVIDPIEEEGLGYLRIRGTRDLLATARVYSRLPNEPPSRSISTTFSAVPVQFAIDNGASAVLQGVVPAEGRYKLYVAEVAGKPLEIAVVLLDPKGAQLAHRRLYIDKDQQLTVDAGEIFPSFTNGAATLRIDGVHGDGRVIVAGSALARDSQDSAPFEMSFATTARDRVGVVEALSYACVALAAAAALFVRR